MSNLADEYKEKAIKLTEALKKVKAFGLFHYEDCPKDTCDCDECNCCDCGMTKAEEFMYETLKTCGVEK